MPAASLLLKYFGPQYLYQSHPPSQCPLQITKVIEKILFAADAEEGQQVMEAAASLYNPAALEAGQDQ